MDYATSRGFIDSPKPIVFQLYSEVMQKFRLAARGHGPNQPPEAHRARVEAYFDPLPIWYPTFEDEANNEGEFPLHAVTQRPMAMYHSWGSMNAWLRQIHGSNRLYVPRLLAEAKDIHDDDWVWLSSRHAKIKCQVRVMQGVNEKTVWTWNAIGKRSGTWGLEQDSGESQKGFLLNHLIDELLPQKEGGYRYACSDPVTGQAAWYDLRVRIEKAAPGETARSERTPSHTPLLPLFVVFVTGATLVYGTWDMPDFGDPEAPVHRHIAPEYIKGSGEEIGIPNIVTSVLASYRGFDTLGETVVVFTAGIGVLVLLSGPARRPLRRKEDEEEG